MNAIWSVIIILTMISIVLLSGEKSLTQTINVPHQDIFWNTEKLGKPARLTENLKQTSNGTSKIQKTHTTKTSKVDMLMHLLAHCCRSRTVPSCWVSNPTGCIPPENWELDMYHNYLYREYLLISCLVEQKVVDVYYNIFWVRGWLSNQRGVWYWWHTRRLSWCGMVTLAKRPMSRFVLAA